MRRTAVFTCLLVVVGLTVPFRSAPVLAAPPQAPLKVMTRNLYIGADLRPIFTANSVPALIGAVTGVFVAVQATDFLERAEALADEIAESNPHVVGLQEVALWRSQTPADFQPPNASHVAFDFLALLLDALDARGLHYDPVATVTNLDAEAPRATAESPTGLQDIRLTDRNVILARTDLPEHIFSVSNPQADNFDTNLSLSTVVGRITLHRGWTALDANLRGRTVRVVNTQLERVAPPVQVAQGNELLAGPASTTLPVVLLGDLNSAAGQGVPGESETPTYDNMIAAGFTDAWSQTRRRDPGFTCCHAANLANPQPTLSERIDFVLVRGDIDPAVAQRTGHRVADRTPSGLWPSDHAGVWAVLHVG